MKLLIVGAVIVTGVMFYLGRPPPAPPLDPADQGLSPSALAKIARIQAEREAKAAMKLKIDPVITRLEAEGITRDDLITYFEAEVVDDLDLDGMCKERSLDP